MPEEGEDMKEYLTNKYGASAAASFTDPNNRLMTMGRKVGIQFSNERRIVNTKRAHALMELLKAKGENDQANAFMVDLYKSYFEQAEDINDEALLKEKVAKYDADETEVSFALNEHNLIDIANKDREIKRKYGVSGVPFFIIEPNDGSRPVAFSGAYPPEIIAEQLEEAAGN